MLLKKKVFISLLHKFGEHISVKITVETISPPPRKKGDEGNSNSHRPNDILCSSPGGHTDQRKLTRAEWGRASHCPGWLTADHKSQTDRWPQESDWPLTTRVTHSSSPHCHQTGEGRSWAQAETVSTITSRACKYQSCDVSKHRWWQVHSFVGNDDDVWLGWWGKNMERTLPSTRILKR